MEKAVEKAIELLERHEIEDWPIILGELYDVAYNRGYRDAEEEYSSSYRDPSAYYDLD